MRMHLETDKEVIGLSAGRSPMPAAIERRFNGSNWNVKELTYAIACPTHDRHRLIEKMLNVIQHTLERVEQTKSIDPYLVDDVFFPASRA